MPMTNEWVVAVGLSADLLFYIKVTGGRIDDAGVISSRHRACRSGQLNPITTALVRNPLMLPKMEAIMTCVRTQKFILNWARGNIN